MRFVPVAAIMLLGACATVSHEEREALLAAPVNCATAEADLAALEAAMPSRRERARSAVQSVTPVGAVRGAVTGTYDDRLEVLTGATEEQLSARINAIETECGIASAADVGAEQEVTQ